MQNMWITIRKENNMHIQEIELNHFRNYKEQKIKLSPNINVFYGDNGEGKTNILEAIFLASIGKSFRTNKEKEMIEIGENQAFVSIKYEKKDREGSVKLILEDKKSVFVNGIKIKKLSELLGNIHTVIFTPDDINVLKDGPQKRRRFLDIMIGQLRPNYIYILNQYLKTLEQRNNYLKQIKIENKSENLLDIWDEKLAEYAEKIYNYRSIFIEKIKEKINVIHEQITDAKEILKMEYISECKEKDIFLKKLYASRKIDILKGFTTKGTHRDDFVIYINGEPVNIYGSQGQNRTVILSLKMSELQVIYDEIGEYPILLLDDFMSELDEKRRKNFLRDMQDTQVIITCTDNMMTNNKSKSFEINKGKIITEL